jgi:hypothetical protein
VGVSALLGLALLHRTPAPRSARAEATAGSARFPRKSDVTEFTHPTPKTGSRVRVERRAPVPDDRAAAAPAAVCADTSIAA